jgi:hypothetical protein
VGQRNNYTQQKAPEELKHTIFELVRRRLVARRDSLQLFYAHLRTRAQASSFGFEYWLKVEFAAAIDPDVAIIYTGSAGGYGQTRVTCPDFVLVRCQSRFAPC